MAPPHHRSTPHRRWSDVGATIWPPHSVEPQPVLCRSLGLGITTPHASRATTPRTCRATTPPTPAQERDGHVRNTQRCMHPAASSTSETEKQRPGPWHTPKTHHARRSRREWNSAQRRQMHVSGALHTDNIVHTGSSTDVHIIAYRHITHRYTPAPPRVSYPTITHCGST